MYFAAATVSGPGRCCHVLCPKFPEAYHASGPCGKGRPSVRLAYCEAQSLGDPVILSAVFFNGGWPLAGIARAAPALPENLKILAWGGGGFNFPQGQGRIAVMSFDLVFWASHGVERLLSSSGGIKNMKRGQIDSPGTPRMPRRSLVTRAQATVLAACMVGSLPQPALAAIYVYTPDNATTDVWSGHQLECAAGQRSEHRTDLRLAFCNWATAAPAMAWAGGQIVNNAALVFAPPSYQTFAGGISGSGGVTKDAAGTMQLPGPNTYYGDTQVLDGTLLVSNSAALQNSTLDNSYGGVLRFIGLHQRHAWRPQRQPEPELARRAQRFVRYHAERRRQQPIDDF